MMHGSLDDSLPGDLTYSIKQGQGVGLLPSSFLCTLGHSFGPFDASGMLVLKYDHMNVYSQKFECVQKNLGMGTGEYGPIFKFRKVWARANAQGLVGIEAPSMNVSFGDILRLRRSKAGSIDWLSTLQVAAGKESKTPEAIMLCGDYNSMDEFLNMPEHLMVSREINACVPGRSVSQPMLLCPHKTAMPMLSKILASLNLNSGHETQSLSIRFTGGRRSLFLDKATVARAFHQDFKSSVRMGCEGGILGYHLATGNEGRSVCTLHG
jgi:hypothetical protein